jgi:hypothetical protein
VFSDEVQEFLVCNDFDNFHNKEFEIAKTIIEHDKSKDSSIVKNFEIEHRYIDLSSNIIGEKIK